MEEKEVLLGKIRIQEKTILSLTKSNESQAKTIESLEHRIKELAAQVAYLNRQFFGRKSEKLPPYDPLQMNLFADQPAENAAAMEAARDEAVKERESDINRPFIQSSEPFVKSSEPFVKSSEPFVKSSEPLREFDINRIGRSGDVTYMTSGRSI